MTDGPATSELCVCGINKTTNQVANACPTTNFDCELPMLLGADDNDAVDWLKTDDILYV